MKHKVYHGHLYRLDRLLAYEWCDQTIGIFGLDWGLGFENFNITYIWFIYDIDAMAFKLRWI